MPNHVRTQVYIIGTADEVAKVLDFIKGENTDIDFNRIIPMPESFRKYDTTNHPNGRGLEIGKKAGWREDSPIVTEELIAEYKRVTREQSEIWGVVGWYDWSCKYWGTKWNAYNTYADGNAIYMDTAWSAPLPVLKQLSALFPSLQFNFEYADEDASANTGEGTFAGGKPISLTFHETDSPEAWELYFETHDWARDYYERKEDGRYQYIDKD